MCTIILLLTIAMKSLVRGGECEYGKIEAWVRTLDENGEWREWRNATVHEMLKIHEPFQVKVKVKTKVECQHVYIWLSRVGSTKAYEVVEGPTEIMNPIRNHDCPAGWSETYEWTIRPTGNWMEGIAALNIEGQFHVPGDDKFVDFTIIAAYIGSEEWEDDSIEGNESEDRSIPGFEGVIMLSPFLIAIMNLFRGHAKNRD